MESIKSISPWHIGISAEAFAAAVFARYGYDVLVQYGANQPEYDLIVGKGDQLLKVSVKGSQDGSWGLTQKYLEKGKADYQEAINKWLAMNSSKTVYCLVQFKDVPVSEIPRIYLASPQEIADLMRSISKGRGDTILYEEKKWTKRANGYGTVDRIPDEWKISNHRIQQLITLVGTG